MTARTVIEAIIRIGSVIVPLTPITLDDIALAGLVALQNSPDLLAWIDSLVDAIFSDSIPEGALPVTAVPESVRQALVARNFSADEIAAFLSLVMRLLEMFRRSGVRG